LGLFLSSTICQTSEVDSLINSYDPTIGTDYEKVVHLRSIVWLTQEKEKEKAKKYFAMCEEIARQSLDSNTIIEVLFIGGVRDRKTKDYTKAKEKVLKVLDYSERHNDTTNINRIHYHIGGIYFDLKEYERAIYHSLRARDDTPSSSFRMHYNITNRITIIYRRIGRDEKVLDEWLWYNDNHDITFKFLKSLTLGKISDEYIKINNPDSALVYASHAQRVATADNIESMEYRAIGNKAHAYFLIDDFQNAKKFGKKAYDYFGESKIKSNPLAYRTARKALGGVYKSQNNIDEAFTIFNEGLASAKLNKNAQEQQYFLEQLLEISISSNKSKDAFEYSKKLSVITERLKKQYTDQNLLRIKTEYDIEKKDLEIKLLNSQSELKDAEINRSKRNIIYAFLGLGLLVLISFLLYNSLRNKKKSQLELLKKNDQISEALADKELLLKEIHHRVKNNLQVVSSLLGLQSEYIKDESALSAINEGRNRVRSMSLIHQNLYKEHDLKGISMKSYLEKLISGLFDTYNINKENVKLSLTIQDIDLDVDTVVPLGLITNELVSNALKHAFKIKKIGTVNVSLQEKEDILELIVSDNGDGLESSNINEDIDSFGYQMIFAFKEKLRANLDIKNVHGTSVKLSISNYQKT
jgi:two-component sensor histidine kinase